MSIHVNLEDTDAINEVCKMLEQGVEGKNLNIDVQSFDGQVITIPHERKEEECES